MLAKYYRLSIKWDGDQTLTYNDGARLLAHLIPWKLTSGALVYGAEIEDDMGFGAGSTLADEGETEGDVQDNTSNLYLGVKGYFEAAADLSSTDGTLYLYLEESPDNTLWPSDKADFAITDLTLIAVLSLSTDAVDEDRAVNFEF